MHADAWTRFCYKRTDDHRTDGQHGVSKHAGVFAVKARSFDRFTYGRTDAGHSRLHVCSLRIGGPVVRHRTRGDACLAGCIDSELDAFIQRHGLRSMLPTLVKDSIYKLDTLKKIPLSYWKLGYKLDSITLFDVWKDIHAEVRRLKGLSRCMPIALHHGSIVCQRAHACNRDAFRRSAHIDECWHAEHRRDCHAQSRSCTGRKRTLVVHRVSDAQDVFG